MKRYADALMIDNGACNPSGIAHAIVEACRELMNEPGYAGTDQMRADPAIKLMVNQLAFLMGNGEMPYEDYVACRAACQPPQHDAHIRARTVDFPLVECDPADMRGFLRPRQ
jgi:hypothetical protein